MPRRYSRGKTLSDPLAATTQSHRLKAQASVRAIQERGRCPPPMRTGESIPRSAPTVADGDLSTSQSPTSRISKNSTRCNNAPFHLAAGIRALMVNPSLAFWALGSISAVSMGSPLFAARAQNTLYLPVSSSLPSAAEKARLFGRPNPYVGQLAHWTFRSGRDLQQLRCTAH
jgi:hypothetical protein